MRVRRDGRVLEVPLEGRHINPYRALESRSSEFQLGTGRGGVEMSGKWQ